MKSIFKLDLCQQGHCSSHVICIRAFLTYLCPSFNISCSKGAFGKPPIFWSLHLYMRAPWYWGIDVTGCWLCRINTRGESFGYLHAPHMRASGCTCIILEKIGSSGGKGLASFDAPIEKFTALTLGLELRSLIFDLKAIGAEYYYQAVLQAHFLAKTVTARASEMGQISDEEWNIWSWFLWLDRLPRSGKTEARDGPMGQR